MSDSEQRFWQDQYDRHGGGALPSDFELHPDRVAEQQAEAAYYEQLAQTPPEPAYDEPGYEYEQAAESYEDPPQVPDPFDEDYSERMAEYLDARDAQQFGQVDLSEQQAWLEQHAEQRQAQAELSALDSEREFQQALPGQIAEVLKNRPGAQGAGEMLAPAVNALAEHTATELLAGLKAEGMTHEQAMETLSGIYPQLLESSVQQVRQSYGVQQAFNEAKAAHFPNAGRR
jgi:hypothetical protein